MRRVTEVAAQRIALAPGLHLRARSAAQLRYDVLALVHMLRPHLPRPERLMPLCV
jgi:hypothetical protein